MTRSKFAISRIVAIVLLICAVLLAASIQAAEARKVFTNSVIMLPDSGSFAAAAAVVNATTDHHKSDPMEILFSFSIPKEKREELEQKVLKGETVDPKALADNYSPSPEDVKKLLEWLKKEKLEVTQLSKDQTSVYARGTVEQLETSLQVKMVRVTKDGQTYNAAKDAPSLPADVGAGVQAIIGLQPFRQFNKKSKPYQLTAAPAAGHPPGFLVAEVLKAYGADNLNVSGDGQTIAILIDRFPLDSDTSHFWQVNGLSDTPGRVEKINVTGAVLPSNPDGEESMDTQWTSGIASKAKIRVYATGSLAFVELDKALDRIIDDAATMPGLRQLSISLGLGEELLSPSGILTGEIEVEEQKFLKLAAIGVNVFVSSGDGGSKPGQFGQAGGQTQTEWMASSPFVTAVGGTSLRLVGGAVVERGWAGSGGGHSRVFSRPAYQSSITIASSHRMVPDVSALADPATGGYVRVGGTDQQIGGTSLSAPVWAGFCALMNEARLKAHKPALPFINPLLYPLASDSSCFRDVADHGPEVSNGDYETGPDYDLVTGIGSPNVKGIIGKLTH